MNIDVIIQALSIAYPDKNFQFEIVGSGPEKENLVRLAKKLELETIVTFVGRVPRSMVISRMLESDCFIMVSENEVFGLVYLEAMACGCLTVASLNGGVDGIIIDGENGFLCEQGSVDSLVSCIHRINMLSYDEVKLLRQKAKNTVNSLTDRNAAKSYLNGILDN